MKVLSTAKFKGHEIQARDLGSRVMVGPFLLPGKQVTEGAFWNQVNELQEITNWTPVYGSLAGDLMGDRECAHAFVAVNLQALARRCSGRGWGHIWDLESWGEGLHLLIYRSHNK